MRSIGKSVRPCVSPEQICDPPPPDGARAVVAARPRRAALVPPRVAAPVAVA